MTEVLSEAVSSNSPVVLDALADLLDAVMKRHDELGDRHGKKPSSSTPSFDEHMSWSSQQARMTQTQYIMQVDEAAFRSSGITYGQLYQIETKELRVLLEELAGVVALQRFRLVRDQVPFSPPQPVLSSILENDHDDEHNDDDSPTTKHHSFCLSLARIASAICMGINKIAMDESSGWSNVAISDRTHFIPGPGLLDLLSKCASHSSVVICALVLPVMTPILAQQVGLATQWLPILQRRAIIPHHQISTNNCHNNPVSLAASDICHVTYEEFIHQFRNTVLAEALQACFQCHPEYFLASCTAAIEEFCSGGDARATEQISFHLEAALYVMTTATENDAESTSNAVRLATMGGFLERCTTALAKNPGSLMSNPLTMIAACRFVRKVRKHWLWMISFNAILIRR